MKELTSKEERFFALAWTRSSSAWISNAQNISRPSCWEILSWASRIASFKKVSKIIWIWALSTERSTSTTPAIWGAFLWAEIITIHETSCYSCWPHGFILEIIDNELIRVQDARNITASLFASNHSFRNHNTIKFLLGTNRRNDFSYRSIGRFTQICWSTEQPKC